MKGGPILRFSRDLVTIALVALSVVYIGSRINREPELLGDGGVTVPPILAKNVPDVTLDLTSFRTALDSLGKVIDTPIDVDPAILPQSPSPSESQPRRHNNSLRVRNVPLGIVLWFLIREFTDIDRELTWTIRGDRICLVKLRPFRNSANRVDSLRAHNVGHLFQTHRAWLMELSRRVPLDWGDGPDPIREHDAFLRLFFDQFFPTIWDGQRHAGDLYFWGDMLIVDGWDDFHAHVERLLFLLDHPYSMMEGRP